MLSLHTIFFGPPNDIAQQQGVPKTTELFAGFSRDGFASMHAGACEGTLLTRPVIFSGQYLFVNIDAPDGGLAIELCSEQGVPRPGFAKSDCLPITADSTKTPVQWRSGNSLERFIGKPVRFRFYLTNGDLYAFWVSWSQNGEPGGYVAAGGPEFENNRDV